MMSRLKELRYRIMLALYFPILLYAFSTFDLDEDTYAVQQLEPAVVGKKTVVLGQPFKARALLAVAGGQGQQLAAEGDLQALGDSVFQMPTGKLLEEDEQEKMVSYAGDFRFQQVDGEEATIPVKGSFRVRRPEIVATSEATQALYRRCLNQIRIGVPGLENRPLRLKHGGRSVTGRTLTLSPSSEATTVRVFLADSTTGDVLLGEKRFAVIDPPRPEIRVLNAGRVVSSGDNIPKRRAVLDFRVESDEEFKRRYPKDARYRVGRATVFLRKGLTASQRVGTVELTGSNNRLMLTRVLREARPGDRITIQLESVVRLNHAGRAIPVPLNKASRTFGFVLS